MGNVLLVTHIYISHTVYIYVMMNMRSRYTFGLNVESK